jgi:hypothetical protein
MKRLVRFKMVLLLSVLGWRLAAQTDSAKTSKPIINIMGFADLFYVYDFNQPINHKRQPFLFNHNRHDEINLNLGFVKLGIEHAKYRAKLALQTGTYVNDNYAAEPALLKRFFEANIGLLLSKKNNIWIDAGVLPSHIGFESAISIDNWTLTRSILAENSPYFLTGIKLTAAPNKKWEMAGLIINGWQKIKPQAQNSLPSLGTQLTYYPTERITLNWSTFVGSDYPDSTRRMRYFNNFYGQLKFAKKWGLIAGFDIGAQQVEKNSSVYNWWYSTIAIGQFTINERWKTALRAEYYQDKSGIIVFTGTNNGFKTTGLSLNIDYTPTKNMACRLETRWLKSIDPIFETQTNPSQNNFIIATSVAYKLAKTLKK